MFGLMQDRPLLISSLIDHAAKYHPNTEIVTRLADGSYDRSNWLNIRNQSKRVANALTELGINNGDRVGTLAWNTRRHMELYFGISGAGAVLHTANPRLYPEQLTYIIDHADDRVLFFDISQTALVEQLAPTLPKVEKYIAMCSRAEMPKCNIPNLLCYDELIDKQSAEYEWPEFDERCASSLCYTSGTTGNPKGVLYSHRSTVIHAIRSLAPDCLNMSPSVTILLIVPMFHANAWGVPYSAAMAGTKLVLPSQYLDGKSVYQAMLEEKVTFSQGVPTVWLMLLEYLDKNLHIDPKELALERISSGGSALPRAMLERFEQQFGIDVQQGWGMTETSPIGVINTLLPKHIGIPEEERVALKLKQGRGVWGVEMKIVDDDGIEQPWDGSSRGNLLIRGPWIAGGYFKHEGGDALDKDGFFATGDVATINSDGFLQLVDRAKDVIKSGGEWISSIDLENATNSHPSISESAIIGIPHPKWQERPLLLVVKKEGKEVTKEELLKYLEDHVAKWWLPDDVIFLSELPHTATGKVMKHKLREEYKDFKLAS